MKKALLLSIICLSLSTTLFGQKISKKEARQLLEKAITHLKSSDSASFIGLWYTGKYKWPYHDRPFTRQDIQDNFYYLQEFLDTALNRNLKINHIEIYSVEAEKMSRDFGTYNIKAWFKYDKNYYKGFGFFVEFIDNKWVVLFNPDTSTLTKKSNPHLQ